VYDLITHPLSFLPYCLKCVSVLLIQYIWALGRPGTGPDPLENRPVGTALSRSQGSFAGLQISILSVRGPHLPAWGEGDMDVTEPKSRSHLVYTAPTLTPFTTGLGVGHWLLSSK
jgi:hypothetical protein